MQVMKIPPNSNGPEGTIYLDTWRCPAVVSDYTENDFVGDVEPEALRHLTSMVNEFSRLTKPYAGMDPVPENTAKKIDALLIRIAEVLAQRASARSS